MRVIICMLFSLNLLGSGGFEKDNKGSWDNQVPLLVARLDLLAREAGGDSSVKLLENCRVAMMSLLSEVQRCRAELERKDAILKVLKAHNEKLQCAHDSLVFVDFETLERFLGREKAMAWIDKLTQDFIKK